MVCIKVIIHLVLFSGIIIEFGHLHIIVFVFPLKDSFYLEKFCNNTNENDTYISEIKQNIEESLNSPKSILLSIQIISGFVYLLFILTNIILFCNCDCPNEFCPFYCFIFKIITVSSEWVLTLILLSQVNSIQTCDDDSEKKSIIEALINGVIYLSICLFISILHFCRFCCHSYNNDRNYNYYDCSDCDCSLERDIVGAIYINCKCYCRSCLNYFCCCKCSRNNGQNNNSVNLFSNPINRPIVSILSSTDRIFPITQNLDDIPQEVKNIIKAFEDKIKNIKNNK